MCGPVRAGKGNGMATIRDVAREAGVSPATVSRVLARPEVVTPDLREQVLQVIERLGYAPHPIAASLKTRRTGKILVTVPDISNPFFAKVIRGIEGVAVAASYAVVLGDTRDLPEREELFGLMLKRGEVDGLIFLGHRLPKVIAALVQEAGGQAPVVNACEFNSELSVSSAHIDNRAAAEAAMDALYAAGHRHVAVLSGPAQSPLTRERLGGARASAQRHGALAELQLLEGDFSLASGHARMHELLQTQSKATGIFCHNDEMAIGALAALREWGLSCPDDVSVVGFDDIEMASYVNPALTTIRQPMEQIGQEAAQLLLDTIQNRDAPPRRVKLSWELVARGSLGAPAK